MLSFDERQPAHDELAAILNHEEAVLVLAIEDGLRGLVGGDGEREATNFDRVHPIEARRNPNDLSDGLVSARVALNFEDGVLQLVEAGDVDERV